jgi:RNA recognition motif-containing protein
MKEGIGLTEIEEAVDSAGQEAGGIKKRPMQGKITSIVLTQIDEANIPMNRETSPYRMNTISIYLGNLPFTITEEYLREKFIAFGEVISVKIMNDRYIGSGQLAGYAYVEMASKSEGEAAIATLHG